MADAPFFVLRQMTTETINTGSLEKTQQVNLKQLTTKRL